MSRLFNRPVSFRYHPQWVRGSRQRSSYDPALRGNCPESIEVTVDLGAHTCGCAPNGALSPDNRNWKVTDHHWDGTYTLEGLPGEELLPDPDIGPSIWFAPYCVYTGTFSLTSPGLEWTEYAAGDTACSGASTAVLWRDELDIQVSFSTGRDWLLLDNPPLGGALAFISLTPAGTLNSTGSPSGSTNVGTWQGIPASGIYAGHIETTPQIKTADCASPNTSPFAIHAASQVRVTALAFADGTRLEIPPPHIPLAERIKWLIGTGLGDTIKHTLNAVGVRGWRGCGCDWRAEILNQVFPYDRAAWMRRLGLAPASPR